MKPKQFLDGNWSEGNYNHKFCFGLKLVKDLKKLAATPQPLFLGELPPPPRRFCVTVFRESFKQVRKINQPFQLSTR